MSVNLLNINLSFMCPITVSAELLELTRHGESCISKINVSSYKGNPSFTYKIHFVLDPKFLLLMTTDVSFSNT